MPVGKKINKVPICIGSLYRVTSERSFEQLIIKLLKEKRHRVKRQKSFNIDGTTIPRLEEEIKKRRVFKR